MNSSSPTTALVPVPKTCVQVLLDNARLADERDQPVVARVFREKAALGEERAMYFINQLGVFNFVLQQLGVFGAAK